jgi:hypothetical protein
VKARAKIREGRTGGSLERMEGWIETERKGKRRKEQ